MVKGLDRDVDIGLFGQYRYMMAGTKRLLDAQRGEWEPRYLGYLEELAGKMGAKTKLNPPVKPPLYSYTCISDEKNGESVQLRFRGQYVGRIGLSHGKAYLRIDDDTARNNREFFSDGKESEITRVFRRYDCPWDSPEAEKFRTFFTEYKGEKNNNREHTVESNLLTELEEKKGSVKQIRLIQPVEINRKRFQLPTPLRASAVKNGLESLEYAREKGGGIDILARRKKGNRSYMTVIELKDGNEPGETPEAAMNQAIAYGTFVRELMRSAKANRPDMNWYSFFRGKGSAEKTARVPGQGLKVYCTVAMPDIGEDVMERLGGMALPFEDGMGDCLELHCITFHYADKTAWRVKDLHADSKF